jgi:hypothetical protein
LVVELGTLQGEIGVALATDVGAKEFLAERAVASGSEDARLEFPVPPGARRVALIFRKHASDGQRSEIEIRRISVAKR